MSSPGVSDGAAPSHPDCEVALYAGVSHAIAPVAHFCLSHRLFGQNSPRGGGSAESERATDRKGQAGSHLVDEVPNVREDAVTQFHAHQTRTE